MAKNVHNGTNIISKHNTIFLGEEILEFFMAPTVKTHLSVLAHSVRQQAARLLRSWVRIPPGAWIFVCCECRVLSGRGLCDELITRPQESYRLCCVVVCDPETSRMGAPYIYDISHLRVKKDVSLSECLCLCVRQTERYCLYKLDI